MRSGYIVLAAALIVGVVPIAWSADEPAPPAATSAAQPAAQKAKVPANGTDMAVSAKGAEADVEEKHLLARGYKKETRNGQTMYCRKELKTGSRFETKQCGTAQSMALAEQQARDLMQNSQNSTGAKVN